MSRFLIKTGHNCFLELKKEHAVLFVALLAIRRQSLFKFLFNEVPEAVPQPGQEDKHFLLPFDDIQQLVVRFIDFHLEDEFPDRNQFADLDIAVIDRAGGLQGVEQFGSVRLACRPLGMLKRKYFLAFGQYEIAV